MGKTILQRWASNPATFPFPDEHKVILGTEYDPTVDPGGASMEQMRCGVRRSSLTIAAIANGTNYATAESSVAGVGVHGISWDTDGWVTSVGGWFLILLRLAYSVPASNGFEYWWPVPMRVDQPLILRRFHKLVVEKNAVDVAMEPRDHDNLVDISSKPFEMSVCCVTNFDTNDKIRVYHNGSQSSGTIASWSVSAAELSFVRLNQEDV